MKLNLVVDLFDVPQPLGRAPVDLEVVENLEESWIGQLARSTARLVLYEPTCVDAVIQVDEGQLAVAFTFRPPGVEVHRAVLEDEVDLGLLLIEHEPAPLGEHRVGTLRLGAVDDHHPFELGLVVLGLHEQQTTARVVESVEAARLHHRATGSDVVEDGPELAP